MKTATIRECNKGFTVVISEDYTPRADTTLPAWGVQPPAAPPPYAPAPSSNNWAFSTIDEVGSFLNDIFPIQE